MYPANSALGTAISTSDLGFSIPIRLKYLLRAKSNTDIAGFAPDKIYIQRGETF